MSLQLDLLSLDTYSLRKIVEKMNTNVSTNFFRCSRGTEKLMNRIKPSWKLEKTSIHYYGGSHRLLGKDGKVLSYSILKPTCSLKFVKIPHVSVSKCENVFFNNVVLPELRAMTPVESLYLSVHERDLMNKVIDAAQPKEIRLSDYYINPMDAVFHNVPSLSIQVHMDNAKSYWKTPKLIELSKIHKKIDLACNHFYSQLVTVFLKNWFNGEQYNNFELSISLARTAFKQHSFAEQLESVLVREDVQLLMNKCVKNFEGNFEVCGRNGQKMFIVTAGDHVRFCLV